MNRQEKDFFDSPNMITFIITGLLVVLIILSQSFAIQSHLGASDIFRSIINHNSIYLVSLFYFILIKVKFGKRYFDYLNVVMFVFYLLTTFASLFTIFQSFGFDSILNLSFNVLVTLYFGYSFFTNTVVGRDLKLSNSPLAEIKNDQYYYLLMGIIGVSLIVSLISASSFENVVVYLLEAIYKFLFVRYIYLYKEYIDHKELDSDVEEKVKDNKDTVKEEKSEDVKKVRKTRKIKKDDVDKEDK